MFKKIGMSLSGLALLAIIGCGIIGNNGTFDMCDTVNAVAVQQATVEAAAATIVSLHATNPTLVTPAVYAQAQTSYAAWAAVQATVAATLVAVNDAGTGTNSTNVQQEYVTLAIQAAGMAASFIALYSTFASAESKTMAPAVVMDSPGHRSTCTMTDAQIAAALPIVPAWTSFGAAFTH